MAEERVGIRVTHLGGLGLGAVADSFSHWGLEKIVRDFLEPRYPEKYELYTAEVVIGTLMAIAVVLLIYIYLKAIGKRSGLLELGIGFAWGLIIAENVHIFTTLLQHVFEKG